MAARNLVDASCVQPAPQMRQVIAVSERWGYDAAFNLPEHGPRLDGSNGRRLGALLRAFAAT
jgi:hypothetical protein